MSPANSVLEMFDFLWIEVTLDRNAVRFGSADTIRNELPAWNYHCIDGQFELPPEDHQIVFEPRLGAAFYPS